MRSRKQVYELTSEDLEKCLVWEFASDEEGVEGQDEATVRPRPDLSATKGCPAGGFICAAQFCLVDKTILHGFVYAEHGARLGLTQPVIITNKGQVHFWFGAMKPKPNEILRSYAALGRSKETVFPISFRSVVEVEGKRIEGILPAFSYLEDDLKTVGEVC